jgi:hypothetical protein
MPTKIFSLHYLPGIEWMHHFVNTPKAVIDVHEHYLKQSYRNRCYILSANGKMPLSIPVKKLQPKTVVNDIVIENEFRWQRQHWESIVSAYNSSPYFFYYRDYFEPLYHTRYETLVQWNTDLLNLILKLLKCDKTVVFSDTYVKPCETDIDLREIIHPKKITTVDFKPYLQVFTEKYGFVPHCSIIDALFNNGPQTLSILNTQ